MDEHAEESPSPEREHILLVYEHPTPETETSTIDSEENAEVSSFHLGDDPEFFEGKHFHEVYLVDMDLSQISDNIHGLLLTSVLKHNGSIESFSSQG